MLKLLELAASCLNVRSSTDTVAWYSDRTTYSVCSHGEQRQPPSYTCKHWHGMRPLPATEAKSELLKRDYMHGLTLSV